MALPDFQHAHDLIEQGEAAEALALLAPWAERLPAYAAAHVLRARAYEALGQTAEAHTAWQHAHFLMPNSPAIGAGLGRTRTAPAPHDADAPLLDIDAFLDLDDATDTDAEEESGEAVGAEPETTGRLADPGEAEPEAAEAEAQATDDAPGTAEASEDPAEAEPETAEQVEVALEAAAEAAEVEPEDAPAEDDGEAADNLETLSLEASNEPAAATAEAESAPDPLQAVRAALSAAEAADAAEAPPAEPEREPPEAPAEPEPAGPSIYAEIEALIQERQAAPSPPPADDAEAAEDLLDLDAWQEFDDAITEPAPATADGDDDDAAEAPDEDLDRLIQELESARIVPRPDLDDVPAPEIQDDIDDVVSETLARIYASQGKFREAARVYEALAREQPDDAERLEEKAAEMRALATNLKADD